MTWRRLLGIDRPDPGSAPADGATTSAEAAPGSAAETATIRRIVARLDSLDDRTARFLAGFAYILSRIAHADAVVTDAETAVMEDLVAEHGGLDRSSAVLVVEIAKVQSRLHGSTEDFLVTREFAALATEDEKIAVLRAAFAVGAADEVIDASEASIANQVARELGLDGPTLNAVRADYVDKLSVIKLMRERARES